MGKFFADFGNQNSRIQGLQRPFSLQYSKINYLFRKKFNFSERVWAAVNAKEQAVFEVVREGRARFGKAGIDYRTLRIMRTETAVELADREVEFAKDMSVSTGLVDWVLYKVRDG